LDASKQDFEIWKPVTRDLLHVLNELSDEKVRNDKKQEKVLTPAEVSGNVGGRS
jgi:hypothetical protein